MMLHKFLLIAAILAGFVLNGFAPAFAQIPVGTKLVTLYQGWPENSKGLYKIKVNLKEQNNVPVTRLEQYQVVATVSNYNGRSGSMVAAKPLTLKAGETSKSVELYLPVQATQSWWSRQITVHIESDNNMTKNRGDLWSTVIQLTQAAESGMPTMLVVSPNVTGDALDTHTISPRGRRGDIVDPPLSFDDTIVPSIEKLTALYPPGYSPFGGTVQMQTTNSVATVSDVLQSSHVHLISPDLLPESWLGLTSVDILMIPAKSFQTVVSTDPDVYAAIDRWVAAGGCLVISECGPNFGQANRIRGQIPRNGGAATNRREWEVPTDALLDVQEFVGDAERIQNVNYGNGTAIDSSQMITRRELSPEAKRGTRKISDDEISATDPLFLTYPHLLGRVFIVNDTMFDWDTHEWQTLLNTYQTKQSGLENRMGGSTPHDYLMNFSIPGVGAPPVSAFKVLVTLFMIAIGPVTLFVLRRKKRMQLLFIVVPLISLLTCFGLISFALFSDGFGIRGRMSSFTYIDHQSNAAVVYGRHCHYAALQPTAYEFDKEDYAIVSRHSNSPRSYYQTKEQAQLVSGGNARPRTPHQIVVSRSFETEKGLRKGVPGPDGKCEFQNGFNHPIELGVAHLETGYYVIENLAAGDSIRLSPTDLGREEIDEKMQELVQQHAPVINDNYLKSANTNNTNYNSYNNYMTGYETGTTKVFSDLMIDELRKTRFTKKYFEPDQYVIFIDDFDDISMPSKTIEHKLKLNVVQGKW